MDLRKSYHDVIDKLTSFQKNSAIVISVIVALQFFMPYIDFAYDFFINSYKAQSEYNNIETRISHLEDYVEVLNDVIEGISDFKYHRGVRYLVTKGTPALDNSGDYIKDDSDTYIRIYDWYYLVIDEDGIEKWMRAIYNSEKDRFSYIDHIGNNHIITPLKDSKIINQ